MTFLAGSSRVVINPAVGDDLCGQLHRRICERIRDDLEAIYAEMTEEGAEASPTFAERVAQQGMPEWHQQQLLVADAVEAGNGERFIAVPQLESGEAYRDMEDFIATAWVRSCATLAPSP